MSTSAQVLTAFTKNIKYIAFDPSNTEHLAAYALLFKHGRQHPTLRFQLEEPFNNIVQMMHMRVVEYVCGANGALGRADELKQQMVADRPSKKSTLTKSGQGGVAAVMLSH